MQQESLCAICLELCSEPYTLPCQHRYCTPCIGTHIKKSPFCPLCVRPFCLMVDEQLKSNDQALRVQSSNNEPVYKNEEQVLRELFDQRGATLIPVLTHLWPKAPSQMQIIGDGYQQAITNSLKTNCLVFFQNLNQMDRNVGEVAKITRVQIFQQGKCFICTFTLLERGQIRGVYDIQRASKKEQDLTQNVRYVRIKQIIDKPLRRREALEWKQLAKVIHQRVQKLKHLLIYDHDQSHILRKDCINYENLGKFSVDLLNLLIQFDYNTLEKLKFQTNICQRLTTLDELTRSLENSQKIISDFKNKYQPQIQNIMNQ